MAEDFGMSSIQGAFGTLAAADVQKKKQALMDGQKKWEQLTKDRDFYLTQAGNKGLPSRIRKMYLNSGVKIDKTLNPNSPLMPVDDFDDVVADALNAWGVIDADDRIAPKDKLKRKYEIVSNIHRETGDMEQTKFFTEMIKQAQEQATKVPEAPKPTKGEEAADVAFAKDYNDYVAQGGEAGAASNLQRLDNALKRLEGIAFDKGPKGEKVPKEALGLRLSGALPESIRGVVTPKYKSIEQDIRTNVLGLLRQTLGPQFTEKEGERIFTQTFDASLPPAANLERARLLRDSLAKQVDAKNKAIKEFEKTGSIKGMQTRPTDPAGIPQPGQTFQGAKIIKVTKVK